LRIINRLFLRIFGWKLRKINGDAGEEIGGIAERRYYGVVRQTA
jgi:hypothetical protein